MASGLRARVLWDDTTIEDRVHTRRTVHIGEGERARTVAPGCIARARRRGRAWHVSVEPGVVVELPGETARVSEVRTEHILKPPFRSMKLRPSTVDGPEARMDAQVELEVVDLAKERSDRALWAWAAVAAILATFGAGSYKLVRQLGDGHDPQWGRPSQMTALDATRIRVRVGPEGLGSNRPQTGRGISLVGTRNGTRGAQPKKVAERPKTNPPTNIHKPSAPRVTTAEVGKPTVPTQKLSRKEQVDAAEAALLQADLRTAIDSFERAAENGPLDYDELNWLGLSHYLLGELDEADKVWTDARTMDPTRPDAINNLASVAKRRGNIQNEMLLLSQALGVAHDDCHALNSMALAQAKQGDIAQARVTLIRSDQACGGNYAYTAIQRAAIESLAGYRPLALTFLEDGLKRVDTLLPIKEFEVYTDLVHDQAFSSLRGDGQFATLTARYLPRASSSPVPPTSSGGSAL
jgi:tetratricopeptide (TPR) repeat protein